MKIQSICNGMMGISLVWSKDRLENFLDFQKGKRMRVDLDEDHFMDTLVQLIPESLYDEFMTHQKYIIRDVRCENRLILFNEYYALVFEYETLIPYFHHFEKDEEYVRAQFAFGEDLIVNFVDLSGYVDEVVSAPYGVYTRLKNRYALVISADKKLSVKVIEEEVFAYDWGFEYEGEVYIKVYDRYFTL